MYIAPFIFFALVAICAVLFLVVFALLRRGEVKKEVPGHVLSDAEREAEAIVREAVEKAQETLADAQYIKGDLMQSIESSMRSIAESAVISFQDETKVAHKQFLELFGEVQNQYKQETQKTVQALEVEAASEMDAFRKQLSAEIIESQRKADLKAEEAYQVVMGELEEYKRKKMEELDTQVKSMVERVFVEVLGKSLTSSEHEKLVIEALDSAKRDGVLGAKEYKALKN